MVIKGHKNKHIHVLGHGWLGAPLALHLSELGYRISTSNRSGIPSPLISSTTICHHQLDISQQDADFSVLNDCDYLIVCITGKDLIMFQRLAAAIQGTTIKNLLYTSSTSVYGSSEHAITEQSQCLLAEHPLLKIEHCLTSINSVNSTVTRLAGLVGGSRHPGRFFQKKPIPDPLYPVNLVHQLDCIHVISRIIEQQAWGQIFNVCASSHPTKQDFYRHAAMQLNVPEPELGNASGRPKKIISNQLVKQQLGYQFIHDELMCVFW